MKKTSNQLKILTALSAILIASLASGIIALATSQTFLSSARIIFGSIYVLFLPGFIISYLFFPETKEFDSEQKKNKNNKETQNSSSIDWIERIALSFALSIAIVPLAVFYLNLIGIKINLLNSSLIILAIIIISLLILKFKKAKAK